MALYWINSIAKKIDYSSSKNDSKIKDYGKVIYNQQCSRCHGADLNGMSNIPSLKNLESRYNALNLASIISKGKGSMMPMPQVSKTQIDLLSAYLLEDDSVNIKVASLQEIDPNFSAVTCGTTEDSFGLLERKMATNENIKMICIDVANGYREVFLDYVKRVRANFPEKILIAGNVATREMTEALILAGADIVKVGIGPGSVCTTRKVAGVGYPQLSAIAECADGAHGLNGHVMSDGGCSSPGDVAKAVS